MRCGRQIWCAERPAGAARFAASRRLMLAFAAFLLSGGFLACDAGDETSGREAATNLSVKTTGDRALAEVSATVRSPRDASLRVRRHLTYREDVEEEWPTAEQVWSRGYGDCEDFAVAVVELARSIGYDAAIYVLHPKDSFVGHAVAVGRCRGKLWFSSNGCYASADSWDDIKRAIAREQGWSRRQILVKTLSEVAAPISKRVLVSSR